MKGAPAGLDVDHYRRLFPILEQKVYFNNCSLGAMPAGAADALAEYARLWGTLGGPAWNTWLPYLDELRALYAGFIGAHAREIAISPCISTALATVASLFDYQERNEVVIADLDFPTIGHQWLARRRQGVTVAWVRSPDRVHVPLDAFEAALSPRTALVATSHVYFTTGYIQDLAALAERAHAHGAYVLIDAYQSVGSMPIDVHSTGVDFLVGGTLKWLNGGPGIAFLYVREGLIEELEPGTTGWFAVKDQFAFRGDRLEYADDATRFQFGTPPVPTAYACRPGMEIIAEVGVDVVQQRIRQLTRRLVEGVTARGYALRSPEEDERRGGIVMIQVTAPEETVKRLVAQGVIVDYRPGLLRASPHFYNTDQEVDRFLDALDVVQRTIPAAYFSMIRLLRLRDEQFEEAPATLKHDLRWASWKLDSSVALLVGNAGTVVEYDGERFVEYLTPTAENLRGISWHPEGGYALITGNHGTVFRFDGKKMTQITTGVQANLRRVAFRPDGASALVVGNAGAAFRFEKGKLYPLKAGDQNLRSIAWHRAGRFAVVAGDAGLFRYEDGAEQLTCLAEFPAGELLAVDWKPDGSYALIVGSYNPWVSREDLDRICKYDGRELFLVLEPRPRKFLSAVAWRPDGAYALVMSIEGDIFRYDETHLTPWYADPALRLVGGFWRPDGSSALILGSPRAKYWTL